MALNKITLLDRKPFKRMISTVGNLPTSFIDSMSYYEVLAWLCQYVTETLIPQINLNSEEINKLSEEFVELKDYVEQAVEEIPKLREEFEALVERFDQTLQDLDAQYQQFKEDVDNQINTKIAEVRNDLMNVVNSYFQTLDNKFTSEIQRIDEKFNTWAIENTIVFNTLQGRPTTLQEYLDDLAGLNRTDAITAGEYDSLELTAQSYDDKEITAHDYDYFGKTILMV